MRILVVGGYGTFGGRLVQLLQDEARLTLLVAGRSREKARDFIAGLAPRAILEAVTFDRDGDLDRQIAAAAPDILVDATGPFQAYGDDPYRVVEACLAARVPYLDLADGTAFVRGIARYDDEARAQGIFILSGVSSFPVLTAAVATDLSLGLRRLVSITGGIAPSPFAGVGRNVIRAIAGYAGKPITVKRSGKFAVEYGLTGGFRYTVAPPGRLPLNSTRFSLVDVPDLALLPDIFPGVETVWVGAGPVPEILHRALCGLAWLVRLRLLPSLLHLSGLFFRAINVLRWGEHRGGMFVAVQGEALDGSTVERSWHLLAEGSDGPLIPSMAVEAIVRDALAGKPPASGARPATGALTLKDYEALFARRTIWTGRRDSGTDSEGATLYRRMLGDAWNELPPAVRAMHDFTASRTVTGMARVERGKGLLSRLVALCFGFPSARQQVPLTVAFDIRGGRETWRRTFGSHSFSSVQSPGKGRWHRLLNERFGPFAVALALVVEREEMQLVVRHWNFLGIPLPRFCAPFGDAREHEADGLFHFDVEIAHPWTGRIVRYAGWLKP